MTGEKGEQKNEHKVRTLVFKVPVRHEFSFAERFEP